MNSKIVFKIQDGGFNMAALFSNFRYWFKSSYPGVLEDMITNP